LADRPTKTTIQLTLAEVDALDDLVRALRRRTGGHVPRDTVWRALLVAASRDPSAVDALAEILAPSSRDDRATG
jgi:hypothetical protein